MKKRGFLCAQVAELIATVGHTDRIVVCDAGFPVPPGVQRIDLAVTAGIPSFVDVLRVLLDDLSVERFILASETEQVSSKRYQEILSLLPQIPHESVSHADFKVLARDARAAIRTGDFTSYSNIIVQCGVVY
jgi:D-ribose pyranase